MALFNVTPSAWTEIIASGGSTDRSVQVDHGQALISIGAPDVTSTYIVSSVVDNRVTIVPAGVAVNAKAAGPLAIITTGDY